MPFLSSSKPNILNKLKTNGNDSVAITIFQSETINPFEQDNAIILLDGTKISLDSTA